MSRRLVFLLLLVLSAQQALLGQNNKNCTEKLDIPVSVNLFKGLPESMQ